MALLHSYIALLALSKVELCACSGFPVCLLFQYFLLLGLLIDLFVLNHSEIMEKMLRCYCTFSCTAWSRIQQNNGK